jgi:hypothetical protein
MKKMIVCHQRAKVILVQLAKELIDIASPGLGGTQYKVNILGCGNYNGHETNMVTDPAARNPIN